MTIPPPPLTPPDSDLRDFGFMPLDVVRFAQSDLVAFAPPEAVVAAILLWGASWHQRPAASLTNDDRALANLAGYGRAVDAWRAIKDEAMRGFVLCSDNRWYHPVVAEKARTSWDGKLKQRHRTYQAAIRQHNGRNEDDPRQAPTFDQWLQQGQPTTVRAAPPAVEQGELAVTTPPVTRDKPNVSRVTDTPCHAHVTHQNGSKGQGEGEGEGEGDIYNNNNRETRGSIDDVDAFDFVTEADSLARRAGVPHTQPDAIARNIQVVREWHADGIDIAAVVIPDIDSFRMNDPDKRIASLRFFDSGVRAKLAAIAAKSRRSSPVKSTSNAPAVKLTAKDQDDPRIASIRAKLNGKPEHAPDAIALTIDEADAIPILVVTARSSFAVSRVDRAVMQRVAAECLSPNAEVEIRQQ